MLNRLHKLAQEGDLAGIIQLSNQPGFDVNAVHSVYGKLAIDFAAQFGHLAVLEYLLETLGADIDLENKHRKKNSFFRYATQSGNEKIFDYIIRLATERPEFLPIKVVYLDSPIIHHPQKNTIYCVSLPRGSEMQARVTFVGAWVNTIIAADVSSGFLYFNDERVQCRDPEFNLVPYEEYGIRRLMPMAPILHYDYSTNAFDEIYQLCIDTKSHKETQVQVITSRRPFSFTLRPENVFRLPSAQAKLCEVPVTLDEGLMYFPDKRPSIGVLAHFYQQFLKFNKSEKLAHQLKLTENMCHFRAHFVGQLLAQYHITSYKAYKFWDIAQWNGYSKQVWNFNCATVICDDLNNRWVWDPWIYPHKYLMSLSQWLSVSNEPRPQKCIFTNQSVLNVVQANPNAPDRGLHTDLAVLMDGASFMKLGSDGYTAMLQSMFATAIPLPRISKLFCTMFRPDEEESVSDQPATLVTLLPGRQRKS